MKSNNYGIIMAGGIGTRFWPESTKEMPKQFLDLLGTGKSFLQQTFERLTKIIPNSNIYILTNERYKEIIKNQLPEIEDYQIITEPVMRNTAPAILYAAKKIHKLNSEAKFMVAPSDHYIANEKKFIDNINLAFTEAEKDKLITLGIIPNKPHTGYGYIKYDKFDNGHIKKVIEFTEKPKLQKAIKFLSSGDYLWNAGIFVWSTKAIINAFIKYMPEMYKILSSNNDVVYNTHLEKDFIKNNFHLLENISIDYGILEKADNVYVLVAEFIWNDLGAWNAIYKQLKHDNEENVTINTKLTADNSRNNLVKTNNKRVVIKDLNNYAIIDTNKVLLIIPRKDDQKVKEYISKNK